MSKPAPYVRPSRVTIPAKANPLARLAFELMKRHGVSYQELEFRSGILASSVKAWRGGGKLRPNVPSLASIEAALGVFGYRLVPCPPLSNLPADVREKLEEVGQHFISDDETLAAAIVAATSKPGDRCTADGPAPRLTYRRPYWENATA
ncbi:hypothetical protein DLM45_13230 [Hyphomicrobium methylovorum]|uniref:helix-turn-helix domain-containing protein n=1 Tax=Hyphomicrobium methylovorum TaxID=84 RepID=UPI0015E65C1C|nr:helix-turn-helix transcriptional regulator [Hyphomicrobium methylovorum]MBA2127176.1 hypothetical protein [Hyphomicrobium methylovorum]